MPRRKAVILVQIGTAFFIALFLLVHLGYTSITGPLALDQQLEGFEVSPNGTSITSFRVYGDGLTVVNLAILSRQNLTSHVRAILDPHRDTGAPTFRCPFFDLSRYRYLQDESPASSQPQIRYFFAIDLRDNVSVLPRLLGSVVEVIRFLGPASCALSIVEGNSSDGTAEVLAALEPLLAKLGIRTYFTLNSSVDPLGEGSDRFRELATLRNMALSPIANITATTTTHPSGAVQPLNVADDASVIFLNDVAICPDDILELVHQRQAQTADMACAMDWTGDNPAVFYDVYVSRAINGDLFFDIPPWVSWERATDLFWNEPVARARLARHEPFQVYACWNGAVVFAARPVVTGEVAFRAAHKDKKECHAGEPTLFCKDLWFRGYGKIMVVPSVNLDYTVDAGKKIKELKGFATSWVAQSDAGTKVEWRGPPEGVKCMPTFDNQSWRPWNESLI